MSDAADQREQAPKPADFQERVVSGNEKTIRSDIHKLKIQLDKAINKTPPSRLAKKYID